jgi:hypothetical protein
MDEAVLIDEPQLIGLEHKDLLHFFRDFWYEGNDQSYPMQRGWFFHDETSHFIGPYISAQDANQAASDYIKWLKGEGTKVESI